MIMNRFQQIVTAVKGDIDISLLKFSLFLTLIIGFMTYSFGYYNLGFSHDSLVPWLRGFCIGQLSIGRPFTSFIYSIFEYYNNKVIMGLISLCFIGFSVYITVRIFSKLYNFDEKAKKYLSTAVTLLYLFNITFISLNATFSFQICCDSLALLCAVSAVYVVCTNANLLKFCVSVILCILSIGLYQAYVNVFFSLFVIVLIIKLANGCEAVTVIKTGIVFFLIALIATILYLCIWKMLMNAHQLNIPDDYNSLSKVNYSSIEELSFYIKRAIINLKNSLLEVNSFNLIKVRNFNILCLIILLLGAVKTVLLAKGFLGKFLTAILCILFVLCLNIANIASKDVFHQLMIFSFCLINVVAFVILLKSKNYIFINIFMIWLAVISFHCCNFYNTISMMKVIELDSTYAHFSRIIQRIESIENFDSNKDTVVMEPLIKSEYFNKTNGSCFNGYKFLNVLGANTAGTYNTAMFASYFSLGLNTITLKDQSDIYSLKLTTDQINMINNMEPYPAKSSVKRIDNYIFVKTSTDKYF